jgi:hypothetical protein
VRKRGRRRGYSEEKIGGKTEAERGNERDRKQRGKRRRSGTVKKKNQRIQQEERK